MPRGKHLPRVELICARCGTGFSRVGSDRDRIYCSWSCAKPRKTSLRTFRCERCGKDATQTTHKREQRFCSVSCARRSVADQRRANNEALENWPNYRVAKARLLALAAHCERCGWSEVPEILELHHLDRNRKNNHRSNLRLWCANCHTLHHYREGTGQFKSNIGRSYVPATGGPDCAMPTETPL
jgi:hypothetical protein